MKTLFKISWRNVWRNRLRSTIVISAIVVGVVSSLFMISFISGMMKTSIDSKLNTELAHIQIHNKEYNVNPDIASLVTDTSNLYQTLDNNKNVVAYSKRFKTEAMAQTARGQQGIKLYGINPKEEAKVVQLKEKMIEGTYLESDFSYPVIIGEKLAVKLKVKLDSKINLSFVNIDSNQISKNFKVCGIFKTTNSVFDESSVFVPNTKLNKLLGQNLTHEILVKTKDNEKASLVAAEILEENDKNLVESWMQRFSMLSMQVESTGMISSVMMTIIIIALLFGIVNTLIMSILERKRELGVLGAIGMKARSIRTMITIESVIYGLVGGPIGMLIAYGMISYFGSTGIDMSSMGEGLEAYGYASVVYLEIDAMDYVKFSVMIFFATIISSLYPAKMATKLNPVEAIRSI